MKRETRSCEATSPVFRFHLLPSEPGIAAVVRQTCEAGLVVRIYLPAPRREVMRRIGLDYPGAIPAEARSIGGMEKALDRLLCGEAVPVPLEELEMAPLAPFRHRVLAETGRIPRGKVRTYGSLAATAGHAGAARAVGAVMAANPFPLAIPCHRVVRSDGSLGGFGGGLALKRALLEREGILFDKRGRIRPGFLV